MRQLPSDLSGKIGTPLQTIGNNADPKMEISVARAKNTITDVDPWTVETIRQKEGLGDISVAARRFVPYGRPNRLYEIHVDNGIVKTALREYPDKLKDGWQDQFILGPGSAVGMAFNGHWERYRALWRLITDEKPWIFWVDDAKILWAQYWDEVDTKFQLSTDVIDVKSIRAWKNATTSYLDQGIVVAFIKTDGNVYYRNFCQQVNYTYMWEYEKQVTDFVNTAVSLNLFLANDYRMGFIIEDSLGQIHWLVTPRNWSGMASPIEFITAGVKDITFEVYEIEYKEQDMYDEHLTTGISDVWFNVAEPIYPEPIFAENPDESELQLLIRFSHLIDYDLETVKSAFTIKDSLNTIFTIDTTEAGTDNSEIIFNMPNFASATGDMTITYDRSVLELDCLNQGSRFGIESFSFNFTPVLEPPAGYETENLTASVGDVNFNVTDVYYKDRFGEENLTVGIADISFVVTKVGDNPL